MTCASRNLDWSVCLNCDNCSSLATNSSAELTPSTGFQQFSHKRTIFVLKNSHCPAFVKCRSLVWKSKKTLRCEFRPVVISPLAETKFNSCSGRQIEDWSWWHSWSFLCALQFCFWDEDLKTNILGWWEFQPVTIPPLAETKLRSCSGRSQQNEPWNLLCISRLVESVIFIYANPQTFSKISFS